MVSQFEARTAYATSFEANVRAKLPAEADGVSLKCKRAEGAAQQAYDGCCSGAA